MNKKLLLALCVMSGTLWSNQNFAQTNTELFGQNRLQLRKFDWKYYQSKDVKVYFYDRAGIELSRYVAEQLEKDIAIVRKQMGDLLPNGMDVVVYNSYDHFQQTNIGLTSNNNIQNNNAGQVNIIGNKIVVYFTGKHEDLKRQIRSGLYSIILEKTHFGENLGQALINSLVINLPKWFSEGYLNYMVDGWDTEANNQWKSILLDPKKSKKFEELARVNPGLSGKAFWKYLIERYGQKDVADFIFIAQSETNMNVATKALASMKVVPLFDSVIQYYQDAYTLDASKQLDVNAEQPLINIENKDPELQISNINVSPRGIDVAYVTNKHGLYEVRMQKSEKIDGTTKTRTSRILSGGYINHNEQPDPNYPILAWSNTGFKLGIIFKKYNQIYFRVYDAVKGKITNHIISSRKFDRILSFTFMEDDDMIVFSAIKNGQSDIFEYRIKRGQINQITNDVYDDLNPIYVSGGSRKGITFLSNRPEPYIDITPLPNELPTGKMKGYFYHATTKSMNLMELTTDAKGDVKQIIPYGQDFFAYITNDNGVYNRNVVAFKRNIWNQDVPYSIPVTNGNFSILSHQYNAASKSIADAILTNNGIDIYFRKVILPEPFGNLKAVNRAMAQLVEEPFLNNSKKDALLRDKAGSNPNRFSNQRDSKSDEASLQSKFGYEPRPEDKVDQQFKDSLLSKSNAQKILYVDSTYIRLRSQKYRRSFKPDFYSVRIDNNQIFTRYQNFNGSISTPTLGGMLSASVYDKMEDFRFTGGYRLPILSDGSAYFFQFDNFKNKIDWGLTYFRETKRETIPLQISTPGGTIVRDLTFRPTINIVQGYANYPLDRTKSIRLNLALRQDRTVVKATEFIGTIIGNEDKYYATSRAEFVHDDTRMKRLNIPDGLRMKIFGEYLYKIHDDNVFYTTTGTRNKRGGFYNFGFDIRNYQQLYKNVTLAVRAAFAHSGGNERIMYVMGGVDNALNAKQGNYPFGALNYAFQSLTTSLRGYDQNSRNGNTFGLANIELRIPVFETFFRKPVQASFWKHLQLVAFTDVGTAWEGILPAVNKDRTRMGLYYAPFNTPNTPGRVTVAIPYPGDDKVGMGYGAGLRTMLYGYFLRGDAAWNINNEFRFHLSMGVDF